MNRTLWGVLLIFYNIHRKRKATMSIQQDRYTRRTSNLPYISKTSRRRGENRTQTHFPESQYHCQMTPFTP
ncbi:hypothetical protein VTN00DRAFT_74 [Thermoascus crustaceus]|uniref:uncharacterized protein n=1 Tax=Thermoascus crustaceus TaxID=5088 RepID=UPI003742553A